MDKLFAVRVVIPRPAGESFNFIEAAEIQSDTGVQVAEYARELLSRFEDYFTRILADPQITFVSHSYFAAMGRKRIFGLAHGFYRAFDAHRSTELEEQWVTPEIRSMHLLTNADERKCRTVRDAFFYFGFADGRSCLNRLIAWAEERGSMNVLGLHLDFQFTANNEAGFSMLDTKG